MGKTTHVKSDLNTFIQKRNEVGESIMSLFAQVQSDLSIAHLRYVYIDKSGRYFSVSNTPDETQHYLDNDIFVIDPFCFYDTLTAIPQAGHIKDITCRDNKYLDLFVEWHDLVGIRQPIYIKREFANGVECFVLGLSDEVEDVASFCLRHLLELHQLLPVFSQLINPYRQRYIEHSPNLASLREDINLKDVVRQLMREEDQLFWLTKREKQCADLYIRCKSSQEISSMLGISERTVERHILNVFHKTGCHSRAKLYERLRPFI